MMTLFCWLRVNWSNHFENRFKVLARINFVKEDTCTMAIMFVILEHHLVGWLESAN